MCALRLCKQLSFSRTAALGELATNQLRWLSTRWGPWCLSRCSTPSSQRAGNLSPAACTACPISMTYSAAWARAQDAHRIRTLVVHQSLEPLGPILHGTHCCGLVHPRRCVSTSAADAPRSASVSREKEESCSRHTSPCALCVTSPIVSVLPFHPLASHQQHKGPIPTHRLLVCSCRRLGCLLLETLLLTLTHGQRCLPSRQGGAPRCCLAHPHAQQVLEQLLGLGKRHPAGQPRQGFLRTRRHPSTQQPQLLIKAGKKPTPQAGQAP